MQMTLLLQQGEDDYVAHLRHGWLLHNLDRHSDAISAYEAAIQRAPDSVEARQGLLLPPTCPPTSSR